MQDTLSEGTAREAQLAPSAVTASAVFGGPATRGVVGRLSPTTSGSSNAAQLRVLLAQRAQWLFSTTYGRMLPNGVVTHSPSCPVKRHHL